MLFLDRVDPIVEFALARQPGPVLKSENPADCDPTVDATQAPRRLVHNVRFGVRGDYVLLLVESRNCLPFFLDEPFGQNGVMDYSPSNYDPRTITLEWQTRWRGHLPSCDS